MKLFSYFQMLNEYLKEKKCDDLFIEEKNTQCLSVSSSKHLAQIITSFIEETFTLKASKDDISDVCKGALFPSLETKPSNIDGIVWKNQKCFLFQNLILVRFCRIFCTMMINALASSMNASNTEHKNRQKRTRDCHESHRRVPKMILIWMN